MSIETVVEGAVAAVEGEAKSVAEAVVAEVAKVEEKVKAAVVQITADEKLFLREVELEFLKAQMEIQRLTKLAEEKSKSYTANIEQLFVKYGITKAEYVFDGTVNVFKKL